MHLVYMEQPLPLFEWDDEKRDANLQKHRIDFVDAAEMFARPIGLTGAGLIRGEERYGAVGTLGDRILTVIFTWRIGRIRLISARSASRHERRAYRDLRSPEA